MSLNLPASRIRMQIPLGSSISIGAPMPDGKRTSANRADPDLFRRLNQPWNVVRLIPRFAQNAFFVSPLRACSWISRSRSAAVYCAGTRRRSFDCFAFMPRSITTAAAREGGELPDAYLLITPSSILGRRYTRRGFLLRPSGYEGQAAAPVDRRPPPLRGVAMRVRRAPAVSSRYTPQGVVIGTPRPRWSARRPLSPRRRSSHPRA